MSNFFFYGIKVKITSLKIFFSHLIEKCTESCIHCSYNEACIRFNGNNRKWRGDAAKGLPIYVIVIQFTKIEKRDEFIIPSLLCRDVLFFFSFIFCSSI